MKTGDLVRLLGAGAAATPRIGVVIGVWNPEIKFWWTVACDGELVHWPESELEVL